MTEKEKMAAGGIYTYNDALINAGLVTKERLMKLNSLFRPEERAAVLRDLIPTFSDSVIIHSPFFCDYGDHIILGDKVFINAGCVFLDCARITIGSNVLIGPSVQLYAATHPLDYMERRCSIEVSLPITIGDDSWIGGGAIVCPGVTIGARCVVAAGSVVTRDVPDDTLVAGNPARIKRKLLDTSTK